MTSERSHWGSMTKRRFRALGAVVLDGCFLVLVTGANFCFGWLLSKIHVTGLELIVRDCLSFTVAFGTIVLVMMMMVIDLREAWREMSEDGHV